MHVTTMEELQKLMMQELHRQLQSNFPQATTQNAKAWWSLTGGGRLQGSDRKGEILSQPRMGWYIYSKNIKKVTFPCQLLAVF